ncbi:MAG: FHA domain-containing protein [Armatimonadota bacterium]
MWRLVGIEGIHRGRWFELEEDYTLIGSREPCHIRLDGDGCAAERQGEFILWNGECLYRDLDHRYMSAVNGVENAGIFKLRPGDTIRIGGTLFRLERAGEESYIPGRFLSLIRSDPYYIKSRLKYQRRQYRKYDTLHRRRIKLYSLCILSVAVGILCFILRWWH